MDKGRLEENNESFDIIEENNESFYPSLIFQFSFIEAFVLKRKKSNGSLYLWMVVEYSLDLKNIYMYFPRIHRENYFKIQISKEKINIMKNFRLLKRGKKK